VDDSIIRIPEPEDVVLSTQEKAVKKRMLRVLEALEAGHSRNSAAAIAGISPTTIQKWARKGVSMPTHMLYPWFMHEIRRSEGAGESLFADIVIKEATENHNWRAAMFVLQKRYKWNDRPEMDNDIQKEHQKAQLKKTKADTAYVEERTKLLKEDGEEVVLDRLRDILDEVRDEVRPKDSKKPESIN
tara:strand:- start:2859 stop:3419 length:561 start_codon:yes stop_codon:yes gene_type:complete